MARPHPFRLNARARATCWSIALCTMFIVSSFTLASGLRNSATVLKESFAQEYSLVTEPDGGGLGAFESSSLQAVAAKTAMGIYCDTVIDPGHASAGAFMISDPNKVLPIAVPVPANNSVLVGPDVPIAAGSFVFNIRGVQVIDTGGFWSPMFASDWVVGSEKLLRQLTGIQTGFNFAIVKELNDGERGALVGSGFQVHAMIGIIEFLDYSVQEVGSDTFWIFLPSSFAIAILAYSFVGSEIADRRREIGILKAVGAGPRTIFGLIMSNAILVGVLGGLLGLALGIVLSYGVATLASNIFSAVLVIKISEMLLVIAFAATVFAAILGAVLPAAAMTRSTPDSDLREVAK